MPKPIQKGSRNYSTILDYTYSENSESCDVIIILKNEEDNKELARDTAKLEFIKVRITSDRNIELQISEGSVNPYYYLR